jgi:hypothetical protein
MTELRSGDKVKWIRPNTCVPHPDGKTDRKGEVLPVFRDKEYVGKVISTYSNNKYQVRADNYGATPKGMDSYYDQMVSKEDLTKI